MGFTSKYLGLLKRDSIFNRITDGVLEIDTIMISSNPTGYSYLRPRLKFDKLKKSTLVYVPDIIHLQLYELHKHGIVIASVYTGAKWFPGQICTYYLEREGRASGVKSRLPPGHSIEYDRSNSLIRLTGKNTGPMGFGAWMDLK